MNKTELSAGLGMLDSSSQRGVLAQADCTRKPVQAYVFSLMFYFFRLRLEFIS
jgi:hypothetical protein